MICFLKVTNDFYTISDFVSLVFCFFVFWQTFQLSSLCCCLLLICDAVNSFSQEMEEFVQSSGENGIVVFTLGSMISNITEEKVNVIASALAQIPQKVHKVT